MEILLYRHRGRSFDGTRHPVHKDESRVSEFERLIRNNYWAFLDLPGDRMSIDTTNFDLPLCQEGVKAILGRARELI